MYFWISLFAKIYAGTIEGKNAFFALFVYYVNKIRYTSNLSKNKQTKKWSHNYVIRLVCLGIQKNCLIFPALLTIRIHEKNDKFSRILNNIYISKLANRFGETY